MTDATAAAATDTSRFSTSPTDSTSSIEIADAYFCQHAKEVCEECHLDFRSENDSFFGLDPNPDRHPLELPAFARGKDDTIHCKKHGADDCKTCFGWEKKLLKMGKNSKKREAKNKNKEPKSNLYQ